MKKNMHGGVPTFYLTTCKIRSSEMCPIFFTHVVRNCKTEPKAFANIVSRCIFIRKKCAMLFTMEPFFFKEKGRVVANGDPLIMHSDKALVQLCRAYLASRSSE